jgi:hypothetical protein
LLSHGSRVKIRTNVLFLTQGDEETMQEQNQEVEHQGERTMQQESNKINLDLDDLITRFDLNNRNEKGTTQK